MAEIRQLNGAGYIHVEITSDTRQDADDAKARYLQQYPHMGYGTSLGEPYQRDGQFVVSGSRSVSCD